MAVVVGPPIADANGPYTGIVGESISFDSNGSRDPDGEIALWIDVGQPDERRLRKACGRARRVIAYAYGGRQAQLWWARTAPELERFRNLSVLALPQEATRALAALASRTMQLQCTIQDGQVWLGTAENTVSIEP
mgnify:CR=1 FL=1